MLHLRRCIFSHSKWHDKYRQIFEKYCTALTHQYSAGIIIIGDEILKAQVKDTNSHFMCDLLYKNGVRVKKISVVSDDIDEISKEMKDFSDKYTYVITSGGIGPTHDDVTFEGLAKAFQDSLHYHPTLVDIIKNKFGYKDDSSPAYKMAYIPKNALLKFCTNKATGKTHGYPCVILKNVHIFPGSPAYCEKSFECLHKELFSSDRHFVKDELFLNATEESFANALTTVSKEFPHVTFGSYPESNNSYYKARVTIESDSGEQTEKAKKRFSSLVPFKAAVEYDPFPHLDILTKYKRLCAKSQCSDIWERSLEMIENVYREPQNVAVCFNGDIESTVIVHLARLALARRNSKEKLQIVYIKGTESRAKNDKLVREVADRYNGIILSATDDTCEAIDELTLSKPQLQKFLVGSKALFLENSSTGQVEISRPLLDWTDENLWTFAKSLCLPYSSVRERA